VELVNKYMEMLTIGDKLAYYEALDLLDEIKKGIEFMEEKALTEMSKKEIKELIESKNKIDGNMIS